MTTLLPATAVPSRVNIPSVKSTALPLVTTLLPIPPRAPADSRDRRRGRLPFQLKDIQYINPPKAWKSQSLRSPLNQETPLRRGFLYPSKLVTAPDTML